MLRGSKGAVSAVPQWALENVVLFAAECLVKRQHMSKPDSRRWLKHPVIVTHTTSPGGLDMGLSISRSIIDSNRGRL
jgi:hypothetical protein